VSGHPSSHCRGDVTAQWALTPRDGQIASPRRQMDPEGSADCLEDPATRAVSSHTRTVFLTQPCLFDARGVVAKVRARGDEGDEVYTL
jgi:hypothetical protein